MRLTARDVKIVRDVALSHVMSRDQVLELDYFSSVTRANARLRELVKAGLLRRLETPFFTQNLYCAGRAAPQVSGERIAALLSGRGHSPRFLQHALAVTNVRIALLNRGARDWRYEQQLRACFEYGGRIHEVRPDGFAILKSGPTALEVDLGHVAPAKFRQKLQSFHAFTHCGECSRQWKLKMLRLLVVTTGSRRAAALLRLLPPDCAFDFHTTTFDELGVQARGAWS